jgi:hypothetical protein
MVLPYRKHGVLFPMQINRAVVFPKRRRLARTHCHEMRPRILRSGAGVPFRERKEALRMRGCVMTTAHLQILQHALGLDEYGRGTFYRNHFCAGGKDERLCRELVEAGHMEQVPTSELFPYFNCRVTPKGIDYVAFNSPTPPKLTRSQQRYRRYLQSDSGYTFIEYLSSEECYRAEH